MNQYNKNGFEDLWAVCASEGVKYTGLMLGVNAVVDHKPTTVAAAVVAGLIYVIAPVLKESIMKSPST